MKTAVICLSKKGYELGQTIKASLKQSETDIYFPEKLGDLSSCKTIAYPYPLSGLVSDIFNRYDSLVFIMALGIVIREISPYINSKNEDPAVITIDESANFCISTLGGHEAGANNLAKIIAQITGAEPVITTASENSEIVIGIGLKKDKTKQEIKSAILNALNKKNLKVEKVKKILTIDIKSSDCELKEACNELALPLVFVSKDQINALENNYESSDFVLKTLGVKGVCQPAALIGSENKQIIMKKTTFDGITIAIAR